MSVISAVLNNQLRLFDTHCHFDLPELASSQHATWQQAQTAGVAALLIPAVEASAWPNLLHLQALHPYWHIALGIHPWWAASHSLTSVDTLERLLSQHSAAVCAVGEIGLDFMLTADTFMQQQLLFTAQLAVAARYNKPVILHHRKSQPQLLAALKQQQFSQGGILHAFSGSQQQAHAFIEQGFKLGIGGTITYERAEKTRNSIKKLPLSSFVLETDAPSMPLSGFQGQTNTPAQLAKVFEVFCQLRPEAEETIAAQLWQNSVDVLRLRVT